MASFGSIVASSGLVAVIAGTGDGAGDASSLCNSSGVGRSGNTFISVAFGCISLHFLSSTRAMGLGMHLGLHPHPNLLPSREKGSAGAGMRGSRLHGNPSCWPYDPHHNRRQTGGVNPGPIWPCLALFTPTVEVGMRPPWPWLASSGVARSDETFKTVSFGLIPSHSSRRPGLGVQPHPCIQGTGDASFPPSRERRGNRCYTHTGEPSPAWNGPQECVGAANF